MSEQVQPTKKVTPAANAAKLNRQSELLDKMRDKPQANWKIGDLEKICKRFGVSFSSPTRGSHYKISSNFLEGILTVPARRPVKAIYIRKFVGLVDAHIQTSLESQKDD
jgi:hypothetical protein